MLSPIKRFIEKSDISLKHRTWKPNFERNLNPLHGRRCLTHYATQFTCHTSHIAIRVSRSSSITQHISMPSLTSPLKVASMLSFQESPVDGTHLDACLGIVLRGARSISTAFLYSSRTLSDFAIPTVTSLATLMNYYSLRSSHHIDQQRAQSSHHSEDLFPAFGSVPSDEKKSTLFASFQVSKGIVPQPNL